MAAAPRGGKAKAGAVAVKRRKLTGKASAADHIANGLAAPDPPARDDHESTGESSCDSSPHDVAAGAVVTPVPKRTKRVGSVTPTPAPKHGGNKAPSYSCEWTRDQFMGRTGVKGDKCIAFPFSAYGGTDQARAAAVKWVAEQKRLRGF